MALAELKGTALKKTVALTLFVSASLVPASAQANPFERARLYVSPTSDARRTADSWRRKRPADAAALDLIARQPTAYWVGGWRGDVRRDVNQFVSRATAARATPVLVAYNIPHRDCGAHSSGGLPDGVRYRKWIRDFAAGFRGRHAIVILEPDALAAADCLDPETRRERFALLRDAVEVLKRAKASVYIDAGNARWLGAEVTARRLIDTGIDRADGFALNVSNYIDNASTIAFGERVSSRVGGKHFVIDTSRNGLGTSPPAEWCNARGQALGAAPTTRTGHHLVDAFLWIKPPGESDGECGGGPRAGTWWPEYAVALARRALPRPRG